MSRGSDYWVFRLPGPLREIAEALIESHNENSSEEPWNRTDMIHAAIVTLARDRARGGNTRLRALLVKAGLVKGKPADG